MSRVLLMRLDAPLVSFGASMVDQNGVVQAFPPRSLLTGLLGNALGYEHQDEAKLQRLQERIVYAARIDRAGEALVEYQTVDLGAPWMDPAQAGWTTRGRIAERGGASSEGTHQRYRHHRADSVHTVALELRPADEAPTVDALTTALKAPARPLFIGRKACLPAAPLFLDVVDAENALMALSRAKRIPQARATSTEAATAPLLAWWDEVLESAGAVVGPVEPQVFTDERDWKNQIHVGRRFFQHGRVSPAGDPG